MKDKVYVEIHYSHRSFITGRIAIISVDNSESGSERIDYYFNLAKEKLSKQIGINKSEIAIFDQIFLGCNVLFVD